MVRSVLFGAVALALTVTVVEAAEDTNSANARMPGCRGLLAQSPKEADIVAMSYCSGIIYGVSRIGATVAYVWKRMPLDRAAPLRPMCMDIPEKVTLGQEVRVVVTYIDARPARMHEDLVDLTREALQAAWPCK
jgi:hypothetical protein